MEIEGRTILMGHNTHCSRVNRNSRFTSQDLFHFPMLIHNGARTATWGHTKYVEKFEISREIFEKFQILYILKNFL